MFDAGKVIGGLAAFVAIASAPLWLALARGREASPPKLELPANQKRCVESKELMRQRHLALLREWRDAVLREGRERWIASDGGEVRISLTGTCLGCHTNVSAFCDRCHDYVGVTIACWSCHVRPSESS